MHGKRLKRLRQWTIALTLLVTVGAVSGCRTLSYYSQAVKGQYQMLRAQKPIDQLLANPKTPQRLRERLLLVGTLRSFAEHQLKLPVDGHYRKYADLGRDVVVWNVEAAPEFSMEPKTWWYPIVGSLQYRGYFAKPMATNYAATLKEKGLDVYLAPASAYSTLGWFKDPVLNTFLFDEEYFVAETIFHELGHQRVFARGDTDFNEAFATMVGQESTRRWLRASRSEAVLEQYEAHLRRTKQFVDLVMAARANLETLFGDERDEAGKIRATDKKKNISPEILRKEKSRMIAELRDAYARLRQEWGGRSDYDTWFAKEINNAKLNSVAAYYDLVPGFQHVLSLNGGDLEKFYGAAERLSKMPRKERQQWLQALGRQ
jgi:predicted aminopeptidase